VAGFIGRDTTKDTDQQLALFEELVIPLLKEFKKLGLTYWIEPCPMPGWNTTDAYVNNIAYCPGMWIALHKLCKKHGVAGVLRITYDESHDVLMGTSHHTTFAAMKAAGIPQMVNRFHGKDQVSDPAKLALWNYRGQTVLRGDRHDGQPDPDPRKQCNAWGVMTANHSLPGFVHYNPPNMAARRQVDWLDHQLASRSVLGLNPEKTVYIIEHEWGQARKQDRKMVGAILAASVQFIKGIELAADAMFQAQTDICPEFKLTMPGQPNPMWEVPGLKKAARAINPVSAPVSKRKITPKKEITRLVVTGQPPAANSDREPEATAAQSDTKLAEPAPAAALPGAATKAVAVPGQGSGDGDLEQYAG
jgi:hypothetical protein